MVSLTSFRNASKGLRAVLSRERNARIHVLIGLLTIGLALILKLAWTSLGLVIATVTLVFFAEVMNTALERTLDAVVTENNQMVRLVKDMAAGAVLITAIGAAIVGLCLFLPAVVTLVVR